ncbi:MAG: N-acylglucosamine 2-epimerase, partial [Clostridiaceae bacterium]|nr:N-acylglucosamine 2-epimerase [Clostridiaceae bacterium]
MQIARIKELKNLYREVLLNDIVPFWTKHSVDWVNGGYYSYLDRDGTILNTDKSVWILGRQCWLYSRLYNTVEKRSEWLDIAKNGYDFLNKYCFDSDGRMFFQVTQDGKPLRKRRYFYSETFAVMAYVEYARATGNDESLEKARNVYKSIIRMYETPGILTPKIIPETRKLRSHANTMSLLATSLVINEADENSCYEKVIDSCVNDIFRYFVKKDRKALLEVVGENGEIIDNPDGRCINPGHSIESSWFLMHVGMRKNDRSIINQALEVLDWSFERGWDKEFGGLLSFVDLDNKPPEKVEWDMKYWWPHTETLYAMLLANYITGDARYEALYKKVHEWTFKHFPDPEYGEWFGYLHRDGSVSLPIKGSVWKGPFHIPRQLLYG